MCRVNSTDDDSVGTVSETGFRTRAVRIFAAIGAGIVLLSALCWLLARVVWLPFYFGVFFFLVAGLIAGSAAFRIARAARPLRRREVLACVAVQWLVAVAIGLFWEYRNVRNTIGDAPRFGESRLAAYGRGESARRVDEAASTTFDRLLRERFPPGGTRGYARWAMGGGRARLVLPDGTRDDVSIPHRGSAWIVRTIGAYFLLAAGLWAPLESLRSRTPTDNVLKPGEEAEEL